MCLIFFESSVEPWRMDDFRVDQQDGFWQTPGLWLIVALGFVLAAIELALWLLPVVGGSGPGLRSQALEYAAFWPGLLRDWVPNYASQPVVMFVSYGFLHSGPVHLVVNLLTLLSLGQYILMRAGPLKFAVLYIMALVGGALGFALLASGPQPMVGASGALFGLAGAILAWDYVDRFGGELSLWPVARAVVLLILLNVVLWWAMDGLLAWQTHLGGFLVGWVVAILLDPIARST